MAPRNGTSDPLAFSPYSTQHPAVSQVAAGSERSVSATPVPVSEKEWLAKELAAYVERGPVRLHSGQMSDWKVDCEPVVWKHRRRIGDMLNFLLPFPYTTIIGPAWGAVPLVFDHASRWRDTSALILAGSVVRGDIGAADLSRTVIVDDVATTGASLRDCREIVAANGGRVLGEAVVVDRGAGVPCLLTTDELLAEAA